MEAIKSTTETFYFVTDINGLILDFDLQSTTFSSKLKNIGNNSDLLIKLISENFYLENQILNKFQNILNNPRTVKFKSLFLTNNKYADIFISNNGENTIKWVFQLFNLSSTDQHTRLLNSNEYPCILTNQHNRILIYNNAAEINFEISDKKLINKNFRNLFDFQNIFYQLFKANNEMNAYSDLAIINSQSYKIVKTELIDQKQVLYILKPTLISNNQLISNKIIYEDIIQNSTNIFCLIDRNGNIIEASPSVNILGYLPNELVGKSKIQFTDSDSQKKLNNTILFYLKNYSDNESKYIYKFLNKNNEYIWVEEHLYPIYNENVLCGFHTITSIIEDIKGYESKISETNLEFEKQINYLKDIVKTSKLCVLLINKSLIVENIWGAENIFIKNESLLRQNILSNSIFYKNLEFNRAILNSIETNQTNELILANTFKENEVYKCKIICSSNEILHDKYYIIFENYTSYYKIEKEKENLTKRIEWINNSINEIISLHEINTGKIIFINHSKLSIGYEDSELVATSPFDLVYQEDLAKCYNFIDFLSKSEINTQSKIEYRIYTKDGNLCYFESSGTVAFNDIENKKFLLFVSRDITNKKNIEEKANQLQKEILKKNVELELFLKSFNDVFIYVDEDFYILDKWVGKSGLTFNINKNSYNLNGFFKNDIFQLFKTSISSINDLNPSTSIEFKSKDKSNKIRWFKSEINKVISKESNKFSILITEITKIKLAQNEILNNLAKEKQINDIKNQFIATTSHEFRTPLATIKSSVEIIEIILEKKRETETLNKLLPYSKKIHTEINRLIVLLDDLLLLSMFETNNYSLKIDNISIHNLISEIIKSFPYESQNLFNFINNTDLAIKIPIDKKLFSMAISNLLNNALKYSYNKPVNILLELNKEMLELSIIDKGIGIPEKDIYMINQAFFRASNSKDIEGTGLGMTIVNNALQLHNFKLSIASKVNEGTTFKVIIPTNKNKNNNV